jgi:hypothetical protein
VRPEGLGYIALILTYVYTVCYSLVVNATIGIHTAWLRTAVTLTVFVAVTVNLCLTVRQSCSQEIYCDQHGSDGRFCLIRYVSPNLN